MMRFARRASLLVAFYLLTRAATASAECAWVLWGDAYETDVVKFEPVQWKRYFVYPNYEACWAQITELTRGAVQQPGSWVDTVQRWLGEWPIPVRGDCASARRHSSTPHWQPVLSLALLPRHHRPA